MALTRKLVYISIFTTNHFQVSDMQREREREERVTDPPKINRTPAPTPPSRSNHHRDHTPPRSHHQRRPIHPKPISSAPSLPMTNLVTLSISSQSCRPWPMTDLVAHDPWPISPFPSIFDHSLFLPLSVWPNRGVLTNGVVSIFVFLSLYIEIFYYKICLLAEKMGGKMWESSRKITFSECNQTHENIL